VVIIGALTAVVAFLVDVAVATVADWKTGYCSTNPWKSRENCCQEHASSPSTLTLRLTDLGSAEPICSGWHAWSDSYIRSFAVYVALALVFGTISSSATMLTRSQLPSAEGSDEQPLSPPVAKPSDSQVSTDIRIQASASNAGAGKVMYMAAGSG
jgi:chloride channel 3/4/5